MSKQTFDEFPENYKEILNRQKGMTGDREFFHKYKIEIIKEKSRKNDMSVIKILDFGCGIGSNMPYFREFFPEAKLIGYDISSESIKIASNKLPNITFYSDIKALLNSSNKFDIVLISNVLHHIPHNQHQPIIESIKKK